MPPVSLGVPLLCKVVFGKAPALAAGGHSPEIDGSRPKADGVEYGSLYLTEMWLGRGWVNVSEPLSNAIVGNMAEVYLNAFDHARSHIGIFTCGQHFPKKGELNLTIVDFGVGIPSNVRLFKGREFSQEQLSAARCMEWAFQRGTSTRPENTGQGLRGLGLDLLREFVQQNGGRLEMFSHEGYVCVADGRVSFAERPTFFEGTLVNISLRCDEKYYCLASELSNEPPF